LKPERLKGSIVPLVTPFDEEGGLDEGAFRGLVRWQVESGSHGVSVAGSTGEPGSLTIEERKLLYRAAVQEASKKVPVVAGTGTDNLDETLELSRVAEGEGVDALLVVVPYYSRPNQSGIHDYFARVADSTRLPLIVYNIPQRTSVNIEPATLKRLRSEFENVVGVKEANREIDQMSRDIAECGPGFLVYSGIESYCFPLLALGGAGYFSATANILPGEMARLYELCSTGEWEEARRLHYRLLPLNEALFWETNPVPVKAALGMMGKISPAVRPPLSQLDREKSVRLKAVLETYGLIGRK
jgi:4-hydroxy-tetrahydrodipicolinate synthase